MSSNAGWSRRVQACARVRVLVLASTIALGSCDDEAGDDGDAGHEHGDGGHDQDAAEEEDVPCTSAYPTYEPGMSARAGALTVTLVSALPAPPRQKLSNDWTLEITDAEGVQLTDAAISNADSYMEVHGHYGARRPSVKPGAAPGQYLLDNIDFKMRGPWQVLFDVQAADGVRESVRFFICVE